MATILTHPLFDASLSPEPMITMRACLTARMSAELLKDGSYADPLEARRTLRRAGFSAFDIENQIDDARQVAMQHVVEREMAAS